MTNISYKKIKLRDADLIQHEDVNITNALFTFASEITDTHDEKTGLVDFFEKQKVDRDALKDRLNCLDKAGLIHSRFFVDGQGTIWQAYYNMTREQTPDGEKPHENLIAYEVYDGDETPDNNGDGIINDTPFHADKYPFIAPEDIGNAFVNAPDASGEMQNEFKGFIADIWTSYKEGIKSLLEDLKGHEIEPDARGLEILRGELQKGGQADLIKILQQLYAPSFLADNEDYIEVVDLYHRYLNQALLLAKSDPIGHGIPNEVLPWDLNVFVHSVKKTNAPAPTTPAPPPETMPVPTTTSATAAPIAVPTADVVVVREPSVYGLDVRNTEIKKDSKLAFFPEGKTRWVEAKNNDMDEVIAELAKIKDPNQIEEITLECFSSATYEQVRNKETGKIVTILPWEKYPKSPNNIKKIHSGKKDILNEPWEWVADKTPPQDASYNGKTYPNQSTYSPNRGQSVLDEMKKRGVHPDIIAKAKAGLQIKGGTFQAAAQLSYTMKTTQNFSATADNPDSIQAKVDALKVAAEQMRESLGLPPVPPAVNAPTFSDPSRFKVGEAPSITVLGGDAEQIDLDHVELNWKLDWQSEKVKKLGIQKFIEVKREGNQIIFTGLATTSSQLKDNEPKGHGKGEYPIIIRAKDGSWTKRLVFVAE